MMYNKLATNYQNGCIDVTLNNLLTRLMQLKNHNNVYLKILLFLTGNLFCAVLCEDTLPSKARLL